MHKRDKYEESKLTKIYDTRLFKRLLKFAKPYTWIFIMNIFLLFITTGIDLSLPYLTKIAIDKYIVVDSREIIKASKFQNILKINGKKFVLLSTLSQYKRKEAEIKHIFGATSYYIFGINKETEKIGYRYKALVGKEYGAFTSTQLKKIPLKDKLKLRGNDIKNIKRIALIFIGMLLIMLGIGFLQSYQIQYLAEKISFDIRQIVVKKIFHLPISFFDKNPVGRLVTRATNDVRALSDMFTGVLIYLVKDTVFILGIIGIMFHLNIFLTLLTLSISPLIIYVTFEFRKRSRDAYRNVRVKLAKINAKVQEVLSGIKVVQAFNQEKRINDDFYKINTGYYDASMSMVKVFAVFRPLIEVIGAIATAMILYFGGKGILVSLFTFGGLVAFLSYIEKFFEPIRDISEKYNILQGAMAAAERIFILLDEKEEEEEAEIHRIKTRGSIEFKNVWFAYEDKKWVLKDVSFKIAQGEKLGIVGYTGSGKTTIISLLLRLYEPQKGKILIDGIDIRKINPQGLRKNIAVVLQEPFLFSTSIKKNISLWSDIEDNILGRSIKVSNLSMVLEKKKEKLNEFVGEGGSGLSTGEKQLITFARAVAFNPPILIMDEATANIDPDTEHLVQDALWKIMSDRTSIVIAHRLATLKKIKRILVIHKGKIAEEGNHQALMKKKGIYYNLYRLQEIK